jgi:hypothetical protein
VVIVLIALSLWGWFDVRNRGRVSADDPGVHKTDLTVYTEAGAAFFDGRDPYRVTNPRGWGYLYLPLFAMLMAPLHALDPQTQVSIWFVLSLLTCWGCVYECRRLVGFFRSNSEALMPLPSIPSWAVYLGAAAVALPVLNCLQRGQVGVLMLYLLLLGLRLSLEARNLSRCLAAGFVLALPVVLKLTPLLPVAYLLGQQFVASLLGKQDLHDRQNRPVDNRRSAIFRSAACSLGLAGGLAIYIFVLPALLVGHQANLRHLNSWYATVGAKAGNVNDDDFAGDSNSVRNQSLTNAVRRCGNFVAYQLGYGPDDTTVHTANVRQFPMSEPVVDQALLIVRLALVGLLLAPCLRAAATGDQLAQAVGFSLACIGSLIFSPIARAHYYMLVLPAMVLLPLWLLREGRPRTAKRMAFSATALVLIHYVLLGVAGRVGLLGIGITLWYLAAIALITFGAKHHARAKKELPSKDLARSYDPVPRAA